MQTHTLTREEIELHDPEGGKGGRWLCPLPSCAEHTDPRRHRSLSLVPETGLWHCHRCHAQGQLKDRWKPFERKSPKERSQEEQKRRRVGLAKILAKAKGEDKQEAVSPERWSDQRRAWAPYRLGTLGCLQASPSALAYLEGRGFKGEEALELLSCSGVRFAPDFGRREARPATSCEADGLRTEEVKASRGTPSVVFPIRDCEGRLVASQGRFLKPWSSGAKFWTHGDKNGGVFASAGALDALRKGEPVAIVEAPFYALSLALVGLPALALCGSGGVPEWLTRKAFGRRFLMAFDADAAGDAAAERLGQEISCLGGLVSRLRPVGAKDWNEILQTGGIELLESHVKATYSDRAGNEERTAETLRAQDAREVGAGVAGEEAPSGAPILDQEDGTHMGQSPEPDALVPAGEVALQSIKEPGAWRSEERIAWERLIACVAEGAVVMQWGPEPVAIRPGVTTSDPERWLRLAWDRYRCVWWRCEQEGDVVRRQRLEQEREVLFEDLTSVLGAAPLEYAKTEAVDA